VTSRAFRRGLVVATALGVAIRLAYILVVRRDAAIEGDSLFYHLGVHLLVDGHGFIEPTPFIVGIVDESATIRRSICSGSRSRRASVSVGPSRTCCGRA
jgi:hypothetical protein